MRKTFLTLALFAACLAGMTHATAQDTPEKITVTYKGVEILSPFEKGLATFNGLEYQEVHLGGKRTLTGLTEVVCREGILTENQLIFEGLSVTNVGTIRFYAQPASDDSVKIMIMTDGGMSLNPRTIYLPEHHSRILMDIYDAGAGKVSTNEVGELSVEYLSPENVPLIAYTTGLEIHIEEDYFEYNGIDYCGLRDKHEHPALWHEKHGIDNYIYYIAKFK